MLRNICVFMFTKNNSDKIVRCLDSTKGIATCICITDTGSTDNTKELIQKWKEDNNFEELQIFDYKPKSLSDAHNKSYEYALNTYQNVDYYITIRAYQYFNNISFNVDSLDKETYILQVIHGDNTYLKNCVFGSKRIWFCYGDAQEVWIVNDSVTDDILFTLEIIDDSVETKEDIENGIKALEENIKNPLNDFFKLKDLYSLGVLYYKTGQYQKCIDILTQRIQQKGYIPELQSSCYYIAKSCLKIDTNVFAAYEYLLLSYNYGPERVDALYKLAKMLRKKTFFTAALLFLDVARSKTRVFDVIKVNNRKYEYLIDMEYSYCCAHDPLRKKQGLTVYVNLKSKMKNMNDYELNMMKVLDELYVIQKKS